MSISASLQKAIKLQEKIEEMREQLADLLGKARQELAGTPVPAVSVAPVRRGKRGAAEPARTPPRVAHASKPEPVEEEAAAPVKGKGKRPSKLAGASQPLPKKGKANGKTRGPGRRSLAGQKRASSPSGPLAPAVVKVLEANGAPMRVADILEGLLKDGYTFTSSEPKKNLAARIYRLSGVRQIEPGLFGAV